MNPRQPSCNKVERRPSDGSGASDSIFRHLRLADVITQRMEPTDHRPRYAAAEIDAFLDRVSAAIPARAPFPPDGTRPTLAMTCRKIGTPLLDVADMICT